ncbi:MAG: PEP-CTERM sorting domain-containing protein [Thermoguttaceae bacterium]
MKRANIFLLPIMKYFHTIALLTFTLCVNDVKAEIVNGGFEQGLSAWDFGRWGENDINEGSSLYIDRTKASEGVSSLYMSALVWNAPDRIFLSRQTATQTFDAVAGQSCVFDYMGGGGGICDVSGGYSDWFRGTFNVSIYSADGQCFYKVSPDYSEDWRTFCFPQFAATGSYTISFEVFSQLGSAEWDTESWGLESVNIDNVCVPEPSTFVLSGIGIISLLAYAWRRRK